MNSPSSSLQTSPTLSAAAVMAAKPIRLVKSILAGVSSDVDDCINLNFNGCFHGIYISCLSIGESVGNGCLLLVV